MEAEEVVKSQEILGRQLLAEIEERKKHEDTVSTMLYKKRIIQAKERSKKILMQHFLAKREFVFDEMKYDNKVCDSCRDTRDRKKA